MTDGMLLAETQSDARLNEYDTLIIDEAHERSLNIDFLLGILRTLLLHRPELKVIITSATLDIQKFSEAFDGAPVIQVRGRTYPVDVKYWFSDQEKFRASEADYVDPRISRMLLEAQKQGCIREVAVLAAALSIRDPRERPPEKAAAADQAHAPFVHPESDFLTLLKIWNRYHGLGKKLVPVSETAEVMKMRLCRFARSRHFLSKCRKRDDGVEEWGRTVI